MEILLGIHSDKPVNWTCLFWLLCGPVSEFTGSGTLICGGFKISEGVPAIYFTLQIKRKRYMEGKGGIVVLGGITGKIHRY